MQARDKDGNTALHLAVLNGHTETVEALLVLGADVKAPNAAGHTACQLAVRKTNIEMASQLIAYSASQKAHGVAGLKDTDLQGTFLFAVKTERLKLIDRLITLGVDVNAAGDDGQTALHIAVMIGNVDMVRQIMALGADRSARNADQHTALQLAVMQGHTEIVSLLLEPTIDHGPNSPDNSKYVPDLPLATMEEARRKLVNVRISLGVDVDKRDHDGNTALHIAVMNNHTVRVSQLILLGVDAEALNHAGHSALHLAALTGNTGMIRHLAAPGFSSDVHCLGDSTVSHPRTNQGGSNIDVLTTEGETALHIAARKGYNHTVIALIETGAIVGACDKHNNTPLHQAALNRNTQTVCELIAAGANVEAQNEHGETSLHLAAKTGHVETVCKLVELGASTEARGSKGRTPLLCAIQDGFFFFSVVHELHVAGANLEASDNDGNTCLHLAIQCGNEEMVKDLVARGTNVHAKNTNSESALLLAAKVDFTKAAIILLEARANAGGHDKDGSSPLPFPFSFPSTLRLKSPLSVASERGNGELCCELIEHGAEVDETMSFFTPLQNAAKTGDVRMLSRLVRAGASLEAHEDGFTVLHSAVRNMQIDASRWIIEHGGDASSSTATGWTALHTAAQVIGTNRQKQADIINLLLTKGADPMAVTSLSQTALDIANKQKNHVIAAVLEKAQLTKQLIQAGGEAKPPNSVAIRFGGPPGAGKSTLTKALQVTRRRSYLRYENQPDEGAANMQKRTKGINCKEFVDEKTAHFTIFDLGGHGEFLVTHQMFIGDGSVPVIDCIVVSAQDNNLEDNVFKWCTLFASRNQPTDAPWPLLLIASRADKATEQQKRAVLGVYHKIKQAFSEQFRFTLDGPLFIDARKSWGELTVCLRQVLNQLHQSLVNNDDMPRQPAICQRITEHLPALRKVATSPIVTKEKFIDFMLPRLGIVEQSDSANSSDLTTLFDKALKFMSGYATVLSFRQPLAQRHIVINPRWLLKDIVGRLMAESPLPEPYVHNDNGYAETSDVIAALETEHLPGREALEMLSDLGFCLEQKSLGTTLNPSKLLGYRQDKYWRSNKAMTVNAGRRLKCKGAVAMAGAFFPLLQVHFYHHYLFDYDEKLPMWMGGILLVAGKRSSVEALLESDPANRSLDIIVRGSQGSERECSDLLHSLTEETFQKALEICPGSQLCLSFLSKLELDELSPAGLQSRPQVEYSEERVVWAFKHDQYVTDGNGSNPESPDSLLLSRHFQEQWLHSNELQPGLAGRLTQTLTDGDWRIVLLRVAHSFNNFDQCRGLADGLRLNGRGEDNVEKLREINPHRSPTDVAFSLFNLWIQRGGCQQSTEQVRAMLRDVFLADVRRSVLCGVLDDELRSMCGTSDNDTQKN